MSKLIDNFIIVSLIKSSEEWEKHKGRNLLTKELVLIKTIKLERFNADVALKERVLNQIAVLKKIHSPSIIKLVKMLKSTHHLYVIYQFASEGIEVWQGNCGGLLRMFVQAWRELAKCGVVHGELSPSAIRFEQKNIKIKNFECGRVVNGAFIPPKSYAYSAPEVLSGQATAKSDVFSLGLIIYQMAFGKLPYPEDSSQADLKQFWAKTPQLQLKESSKLEPDLIPILSAMLEKEIRSRCTWEQLWKLLQSEPSTISRDYTLARSSEDCSTGRKRKQELIQQQHQQSLNNEEECGSALGLLAMEYGRRRNKLSLLAGCLKELLGISPTEQLQRVINAVVGLIKRYSHDLQQFVRYPSKHASWVDPETERVWRSTQLYQLACQDEFEHLHSQASTELPQSELILELKNLQVEDGSRKSIRSCVRQLSDLNLANNGVLTLRATQNMFESVPPALSSTPLPPP